MPVYPSPSDNPECQCAGSPLAQMFCPFGHMTECHYPLTCSQAECSHYLTAVDAQIDDLLDGDEFDES